MTVDVDMVPLSNESMPNNNLAKDEVLCPENMLQTQKPDIKETITDDDDDFVKENDFVLLRLPSSKCKLLKIQLSNK